MIPSVSAATTLYWLSQLYKLIFMVHKEVDPRDPELRIERLLDPGSVSLLVERTDCGMIAATGAIKGNRVVVFASDATIKSGALGVVGSKVFDRSRRQKPSPSGHRLKRRHGPPPPTAVCKTGQAKSDANALDRLRWPPIRCFG